MTILNAIIRKAYPNAKVFASNVKGIKADRNPDTVESAQELNGTDVGIIEVTLQLQRMDVSGYHKP